ncbi:MAG: ATP-binding protein [Planctomycetaceae bacterium]|nr:ATP-binding protein [Planctomycetaceae bacterium]
MSGTPDLHMQESWESTTLWKTLTASERHDTNAVVTVLKGWMPTIEAVLKHGGTSPPDFTLHDEMHAFRVAQRMAEITPPDTLSGLSSYEIAFLLMSAYLHDIGMTPENRKVTEHYQYLLAGDVGTLTATEVEEFQRWLDDDQDGVTPPLCVGKPTIEQLQQANRLLAHYCRHQHNDWSEEWIRKHAPKSAESNPIPLGTFRDWIDDLIRLCRSHHYGWEELKSDHFNPRQVGNPGQVLHLRYLACLLRIGDVLEFDPERTPAVVLSHRAVSPKSVIFWHKDHEISPRLENGRLILAARPGNAWLYRAIEEMVDQIDTELALCRALADDTHFEHCPGLIAELPHRWILSPAVHRDLKPKPETFVYINSSFRPNTEKVLQILSGTALYGDPFAAVRELLQNAFDAVREAIAYQRLRRPKSEDRALELELGRMHRVELRIERQEDGYWLVCTDSGIGMNKEIIENYLLVSGQSRRHDVAELERRCRKAGFSTGRTGQFGIGVLSYFMIADRMRIATRRSADANDGEAHGWKFETDGIGRWGELRAHRNSDTGTRLELHVNETCIGNPTDWFASLSKYLNETLICVPCEFQLNSCLPNTQGLSLSPGWTRNDAYFSEALLRELKEPDHHDPIPTHLLPKERQLDAEDRTRRWQAVRDEARKCLRWAHDEGDLADGRGRYRLHLPYFELVGGPSFAFLDVETEDKELFCRQIGLGFAYFPERRMALSWKGMDVSHDWEINKEYSPFSGVLCEIDFQGDHVGTLAANRMSLRLSKDGIDSIRSLTQRTQNFVQEFVGQVPSSRFAALNACVSGQDGASIKTPYWIEVPQSRSESRTAWRSVIFPAVDGRIFRYHLWPHTATWNGGNVTVLPALPDPRSSIYAASDTAWNLASTPPDKVLGVVGAFLVRTTPLWQRNPWRAIDNGRTFPRASFPPSWKSIVGVYFDFDKKVIWNRHHKLVGAVTNEAGNWVANNQDRKHDPLLFRDEILGDRATAIAWVLGMLQLGAREVWLGLNDRDPVFIERLWKTVFGKSTATNPPESLAFWREGGFDAELVVITYNTWHQYSPREKADLGEIHRWMPETKEDWTLTVDTSARTQAANPTTPTKTQKRNAKNRRSTPKKK